MTLSESIEQPGDLKLCSLDDLFNCTRLIYDTFQRQTNIPRYYDDELLHEPRLCSVMDMGTRVSALFASIVLITSSQAVYATPRIIDKEVVSNAGADLAGRNIDARVGSADFYAELEVRFGSDYARSIIAQWDLDLWQFLRYNIFTASAFEHVLSPVSSSSSSPAG